MPMRRSKAAVAALLCLTVILGISASADAESFDKPVRKTVVNLGRSRYLMPNDPARVRLSCFYYQDSMVKELIDPGVKGTLWVTVTPIVKETQPGCHLAHASTERFMAKGWWRFEGVKGALLFLEDAEGDSNGGMAFRILDLKTGKKVFEDSAWWNGNLEFERTTDDAVSLRYLRVVGGDCSIPKGGKSCWSKFRRRYGLAVVPVPKCIGYRREGEKEWAPGDKGVPPAQIDCPSAIAYPVVVELFPQPLIKAVPGEIKCNPVP